MTVTKVSAWDPPAPVALASAAGGVRGGGRWEGALVLGRCSTLLICSPSCSSRFGPQGLRREGGGCCFGAAVVWTTSLRMAQPQDCIFNPCLGCCIFNPWRAVLGSSLVSTIGARRRGRPWQGLVLFSGVGMGCALRRPAEGKAHHTCRPLPRISGALAPRQRHSVEKALPVPGVAPGDRKGSEVTGLKIWGGNMTREVKWAFWKPSYWRKVLGPCHRGPSLLERIWGFPVVGREEL